jgi:hypothetical protein
MVGWWLNGKGFDWKHLSEGSEENYENPAIKTRTEDLPSRILERYRYVNPLYLRMTCLINWTSVFWYVTPCSPAEVDRRFEGAYCLYLQGRESIQRSGKP